MKVGCCAKIDEYKFVCEMDFGYIEFAGKAIAALSDNSFDELYANISNNSMPCLALNAYCTPDIVIAGPGFDQRKAREYARKLAFRASMLGVRVVNIGSPMSRKLPPEFNRETANVQIRQFYSDTADEFAKYGIIVTVESLGYCYCNFINKMHEAIDIVKDVSKENLKIVLDFYNMQQSGEANIDISAAIPYLYHVHDSDDAGSPKLRSFFSKDKFEIHENNIKQLKVLGYDGSISIEVDVPFQRSAAQSSLDLIKRAWR